ncbi:hypothetical protein [Lacticaseibacillus paracasei]|uniref:hypothetical protein n=1 Tax=Lacticaseibacillus paracasei TaxID=1597 RepID=UPI0021C2687A|nr:hypothetical protein [Lacticaseibacillus paracasei]MCP9309816.1 hypothetical protein [Lacticaseibacillus paracasei]MCP9346561.1 hypothetical protein [Lacticaseibacillus paracasei]MCP9366163.1 hypothetical protein [Lacticaseibacillus paracasei]MCP9378541.1 hypothetical protein [Lacticaseibacillus paracasei]
MAIQTCYKDVAVDLLYVLNRIKANVNSDIVSDADKIGLVRLCLADVSVKDTNGELRSVSSVIDELLNGQF